MNGLRSLVVFIAALFFIININADAAQANRKKLDPKAKAAITRLKTARLNPRANAPKKQNKQAAVQKGGAYKTKLPNGLTVIIEENPSAPVVAIETWVRVGSADETEAEAGLSHVFEHMLFKGTSKRKVGEIAGVIESLGGGINAFTSYDNTVYHLTVPSRHFLTGLDVMSDALRNSSFDPAELARELQVVLEELRMNEDSPGRSLYKNLFDAAYQAHPYKRPVIGYEKVILGLTREEILAFFKRWYVPNNMTLVVAGDVDRDSALAAIKEAFKEFKSGPDQHRKRPVEPPQNGVKTRIITQDVIEPHLGIAYHIPELKNADTYAIDVAAGILGDGASSRLYADLRARKALVHSISAYAMTPKEPGLFFITATLDAKNIAEAAPRILYAVKRLGITGPSPDELEKVKTNLESSFIYGRETMEGIADKLGYYETISGDMNYERKYIENIRKVTTEDVARVVNKYLVDGNMTFAAILPKASKDALTQEGVLSYAKQANDMAAKEALQFKETAAVTKVILENGATLIVKEVHSNPTVAVYATFPGGLRHETSSTNGIGAFTAQMLTRGTKTRTRETLARELDELAGGVSGFSGWNTTGASGKFLSSSFNRGFEIFADVVMNPAFSGDEIEKLKSDVNAAILAQEDNLPAYTFKLLYRSLFKKHPYGMPTIGSTETVSSFKREDAIKHYEAFFAPERMVITIVGDVKTPFVIEKARSLFKGFKRSGGLLIKPLIEERPNGISFTGATKQKAQINIGIGFQGTYIGSADSYPLDVMTEVLAGQGGRLFVNLRDKESLAYSVSAFSKKGADPGIIGFYIGAAPSKKDAAIKGIMNELTKILSEKVTDAELSRAKNSLIGGYEIGLQEVSAQSADMANNEIYGLGYAFSKTYPKKIEAVTADDVQSAARKYLILDAYTISIVGP
ncbi:MAG: insulinase family protein [Deltaproteobacteria bacterium]|nr:insulinase family protein [Deltaproteobacteria bacterium]